MNLQIINPVVIATSADVSIIVSSADEGNLDAMAQLYSEDEGYSPVKPLQVHLKFLYIVDDVAPPRPWEDPQSGGQ